MLLSRRDVSFLRSGVRQIAREVGHGYLPKPARRNTGAHKYPDDLVDIWEESINNIPRIHRLMRHGHFADAAILYGELLVARRALLDVQEMLTTSH